MHALGLDRTLRVARLDVKLHAHELPSPLDAIQLHELPIALMLPARRKGAPFSLFHGTAKPKELLYFARQHASLPFELPPNPHLSREQHAAWKVQIKDLPEDKRERAYAALEKETGQTRDELLKEEL